MLPGYLCYQNREPDSITGRKRCIVVIINSTPHAITLQGQDGVPYTVDPTPTGMACDKRMGLLHILLEVCPGPPVGSNKVWPESAHSKGRTTRLQERAWDKSDPLRVERK